MSWFLRNAWIIPALPAVSFVIILLLGKRFPKKGSEVGIAAVGASFVLAILTAIAWIRQPLAGTGDARVRAFLQKDLFGEIALGKGESFEEAFDQPVIALEEDYK